MPRYVFMSRSGRVEAPRIGFVDDEHALDYAERLTSSLGCQVLVYDERGQCLGSAEPRAEMLRHDGPWLAEPAE
jgi:hypothetical protein